MGQNGTISEVHDPSFQELHDLVNKALRDKYKDREGYSQYYIDRLWPDKVLVLRAYMANEEYTTKWGLINFEVEQNGNSSKVNLSDLTPVSIQAVPKDGGDGIIIDEAGKRNANADANKINQAIRVLLATLNDNDLEEETINALNAKMLAPINGEGDFQDFGEAKKKAGVGNDGSSEGQTQDNQDVITEAWNGLPGETFQEAFNLSLSEAEIDYDHLVLKNVVLLGPVSTNGRIYPVETQKNALPLFEGIAAYVNHPKSQDMNEPRDMRDLIGEHKNVRVVGNKTISDLHLIDNAVVRDVILPVAEQKSHIPGNSIVARGKMSKKEDGSYVVDQILAARSVDIVTEPATTKGLFTEGKQLFSSEGEMELKDLTLESLKKDRPDLLEAILNSAKEQEKVIALEAENSSLKTAIGDKDKEIAELRIKEAKRERSALIESVIRETKIPDSVKYETKEGIKTIKSYLVSAMERCESEEEMRKAASDLEEVYRQVPISEEKKLSSNGAISEHEIGRLQRALS